MTETQVKQTNRKNSSSRKFTDDTDITVISNVKGSLYYRNNNDDDWEWGEYGDEHELTVRELKRMKAQQKRFFEEQWVIFSDKDSEVIKHLKLEKHYQNVVFPEDIEALFDKDVSEFVEALDKATDNVKALLLAKAREKYESKELVNAHIIRAIEERLNVSIDINNPR